MKRFLHLVLLLGLGILLPSCRKAPFLSVDGPRSISFSDSGGSQTFTFSTNCDWQIVSSESWIRVSPASGTGSDSPVTVTVSCGENTSYDTRTAILTLTAEGLTENVSISQDTNFGLFVLPTVFDLSYKEQTIAVQSQSNVSYSVVIDEDCKSWVSEVQTKGLVESSVSLLIARNEGGARSGKVTFCSESLSEEIIIRQNGIFIPFEDEVFKAYCVINFDLNGDGEIDIIEEADKVDRIDVNDSQIHSLEGIQYFTKLTWLNCGGNQLTSLDVSSNAKLTGLSCGGNQLTSLDVSSNAELTWLDCYGNQLTSLDVSSNADMTWLNCYSNELTSLDVSSNAELTGLNCGDNELTSLDVSSNAKLIGLYCYSNELTSLDVSSNTKLTDLYCGDNELTSLDVSSNAELTWFDCYSNELTSLDVSSNIKLTSLSCYSNELTSLDVSRNAELTGLNCGGNQLTSLDVSRNAKLTGLYCYGNELTSLDVSSNTKLTDLYCGDNELTSLDVSSNTKLTSLSCYSNELTSLDVSRNAKLTSLHCNYNPLKTLTLKTGCQINGININRDGYYIPDETEIIYVD